MDVKQPVHITMSAAHWLWLTGFIAALVQPGVRNETLDSIQRQINEALKS